MFFSLANICDLRNEINEEIFESSLLSNVLLQRNKTKSNLYISMSNKYQNSVGQPYDTRLLSSRYSKDSETKERLKKARSTISTAVCRRPKSKSTPLERDGRLIERKKRVNEREDQRLMRRLRRRKREQLKSDFMVHSKVYCNIIKKSDSLFQLKRFEMSFKTYVDGVSLYYFSCSLVCGESFFFGNPILANLFFILICMSLFLIFLRPSSYSTNPTQYSASLEANPSTCGPKIQPSDNSV